MRKSNSSSVRRDKSTQGIRRGTCGWITSLLYYNSDSLNQLHSMLLNQKIYWLNGPIVKPGITPALQAGGYGFKSRSVHCNSV